METIDVRDESLEEEVDPSEPPALPRWTRTDTFAATAITVAAGALRLIRLDDPGELVFDETYYAKDACWYINSSPTLCGIDGEENLVHPPLAKWLIAIGIRLFGYDSFGWRIGAAVAGTITVWLLYLLARRLLNSTLGASLASGLLAVDLLHFVESRIAMLDIFVPMFGIAAVLFLVYDRDMLRADVLARPDEPPEDAPPDERVRGPAKLLERPWLIAAGMAAGAAIASKWSGGFFLVMLIVLAIAWEIGARRERNEPRPVTRTLARAVPLVLVWLVLAPLFVYAFTYVGRLPGPDGLCLDREGAWPTRFVQQQQCMWDFHRGLESNHSYQSPAWSWIALKRPVSYFFETAPNGDYQEIFAAGSPFVWWTSALALIVVAIAWIRRRVWYRPEGVILAGFLFTYVPWLISDVVSNRSAIFLFYLLPSIPFMCLAIGYVATRLGRSWEAKASVALYAAAALWFFVFYYPLLTKAQLPYEHWDKRIWVFDNCDKPASDPRTTTVTQTTGNTTTTQTSVTTEALPDVPPTGWCWI